MSRAPTYQGGGFIETTHKGRHYDCIYRSEDGDCMKRGSHGFGQMCREVKNCTSYDAKANPSRNGTSRNVSATNNPPHSSRCQYRKKSNQCSNERCPYKTCIESLKFHCNWYKKKY